MKLSKILLTFLVSGALVSATPAFASDEISVIVNSRIISFDTEPFIENDRTLVPIRAITEAMDFDVDWDSSTRTAIISNAEKSVTIPVDSYYLTVNTKYGDRSEKSLLIDVPALIKNDRTYLPLRALSEAFDAQVDWVAASRTVGIDYELPETVTFSDSGFEKCIRNSLYIYSGDITERMLEDIKWLDASYSEDEPEIKSIADISHLPNLTSLDLSGQSVSDISPLKYRKKWEYLDLSGLNIEDDEVLEDISAEAISFPNVSMYWSGDNYKQGLGEYEKLRAAVNKVISSCNKKSMSDYEKYKALHDYLVKNIDYDYDYIYSENASGKGDLYLALVDGKGVCAVYASAYRELCEMCGLECIEVFGEANGITHIDEEYSWQPHSWNMVKLDGNYYHVDVTWDDPLTDDDYFDDYISYEYFLLSDDELEALDDHDWDEEEYPSCRKKYKNGTHNKSDSDDAEETYYTDYTDYTEQETKQGGSSEESESDYGYVGEDDEVFDLTEFREQLLYLINRERKNAGLKELKEDTLLDMTAQEHSENMVLNGFFDHIDPDGNSPFDRMESNGVSYMAAAENIAMGQSIPEEVLETWMNSKGHRENILTEEFRKTGIGIYQNEYGILYWTQTFTD